MNPSERTFNRFNSVLNFSAKGNDAVENVSAPIEAWSLLLSNDVLNIILKCTNQEIRRSRNNCKSHVRHKELEMHKLKAFIVTSCLLCWLGKQKKCFHT